VVAAENGEEALQRFNEHQPDLVLLDVVMPLMDGMEVARRIRAQTGHLKGVKIAIMGCIVNGPGEMADADFGYVGGAPGKINLYVGRQCVQYNIPQDEADARLIALIREHGKWVDPEGVSKS
jgi:(E)-4-hydroxy-3-methylbut-2-enyl-diphosphate synthase